MDDHRPAAGTWGRFDDLLRGEALLFHATDHVLVAHHPAEVADVLTEVQGATDAGRWAFGYLAYEAAAGLDPALTVHPETPLGMPLVWFGIGTAPTPAPALSAPAAHPRPSFEAEWTRDWTPAGHSERVAAIKSRIAAGDTYQCNLTERMIGQMRGDLSRCTEIWPWGRRRLQRLPRPRPVGDRQREPGAVLRAPRKRCGDAAHERDRPPRPVCCRRSPLAEQLRASEKERAENLMIVDLLRNDLSRVAETGSVGVPELFTVERYRTVLQMTSSVVARLRPRTNLVELFTALFPSGSITGAPKATS